VVGVLIAQDDGIANIAVKIVDEDVATNPPATSSD